MKRAALPKRMRQLKRRPMRRINRARLQARRARQFGQQAALARKLPCCSCGAPPPSDPSHLTSRGAGGVDDCVVPQCRRCHDALHREGRFSFWTRRGLDPQQIVERMRALVALGVTPCTGAN